MLEYAMLKTQTVLDHFDGSYRKVAEFFDIQVQAVYQWKEHVPRERELELMLRIPEKFANRRIVA